MIIKSVLRERAIRRIFSPCFPNSTMNSGVTDGGEFFETKSRSFLRAFWRESSRICAMSSGALDQLKLSGIGITGACTALNKLPLQLLNISPRCTRSRFESVRSRDRESDGGHNVGQVEFCIEVMRDADGVTQWLPGRF